MKYWFVQVNKDRYDLREEAGVGTVTSWDARKKDGSYLSNVKYLTKGDFCLFWQSGSYSGVIGFGQIIDITSDNVDIQIDMIFDEIITKTDIYNTPGFDSNFLGNLGIQGTFWPIPIRGWYFLKEKLRDYRGINLEEYISQDEEEEDEIISDELLEILKKWEHNLSNKIVKEWNSRTTRAYTQFHKILKEKSFKDEKKLAESEIRALFEQLRHFSKNRSLTINLFHENVDFVDKLWNLYYGSKELPFRIDEFLELKSVGLQTVSQFLVGFDPQKFPLITEVMINTLNVSEKSKKIAEEKAFKSWADIDIRSFNHSQTLNFLIEYEILKEIKQKLNLPDYSQLNKMLWIVNIQSKVDQTQYENKEPYKLPSNLFFSPDQKLRLESQISNLIQNKTNIILIGPPGTGKTVIAKDILSHYKDEDYLITTATSEWTTSETIGTYFPEEGSSNISFRPGIFLQCLTQPNKWLLIDEINRADIDKAFGAFFTVLSGSRVTLPYQKQGKPIEIVPEELIEENDFQHGENFYIVPENWRILATMNTFDKSSLFEMSYAFMRRFAFIHIDVPEDVNSEETIGVFCKIWQKEINSEIKQIFLIWELVNSIRKIGPALIKDIVNFVSNNGSLVDSLKIFVAPQFEGLDEEILSQFTVKIGSHFGAEFCTDFKKYLNDFFEVKIG